MKRGGLVAIAVLTFVMATCAFGQVSLMLKANVPFDFTTTAATLPAGEYTLDSRIAGSYTTILLQGDRGRSGVFLLTNVAQWKGPEEPKAELVFHRYGDRYFLVELWTGDGAGRQFPMSKEERELARGPSQMQVAAIPMLAR
jgi:hypothetical protein